MSAHLGSFQRRSRMRQKGRKTPCSNGDVHKQLRKWMFIVNNWKCPHGASYNSCSSRNDKFGGGGVFGKERRRSPFKSDDILDYPI